MVGWRDEERREESGEERRGVREEERGEERGKERVGDFSEDSVKVEHIVDCCIEQKI